MPATEKHALGVDLREILLYAIANNLSILHGLLNNPARDAMLDQQIAAGWGSTPQCEIPPDWRRRPGPEKCRSLEERRAISRGLLARFDLKPRSRRVPSAEPGDDQAA